MYLTMHNSSATVLAVLSFRFYCSCNRGLNFTSKFKQVSQVCQRQLDFLILIKIAPTRPTRGYSYGGGGGTCLCALNLLLCLR